MNIIMQRVYGVFVIPRLGDYRVMSVLRFGTAFVPLFWLFVTGARRWYAGQLLFRGNVVGA